jgi:hypothetical protein
MMANRDEVAAVNPDIVVVLQAKDKCVDEQRPEILDRRIG